MAPPTAAALQEAPQPPDLEALTTRHAGRVRPRDVRALHRWLSSLPALPPTLEVAASVLEAGARWLRSGGVLIEVEPPAIVRLRLLVDVLAEGPSWRAAFGAAVARAIADGAALPALESGLPNDRGL